jgi:hypothetical protein
MLPLLMLEKKQKILHCEQVNQMQKERKDKKKRKQKILNKEMDLEEEFQLLLSSDYRLLFVFLRILHFGGGRVGRQRVVIVVLL